MLLRAELTSANVTYFLLLLLHQHFMFYSEKEKGRHHSCGVGGGWHALSVTVLSSMNPESLTKNVLLCPDVCDGISVLPPSFPLRPTELKVRHFAPEHAEGSSSPFASLPPLEEPHSRERRFLLGNRLSQEGCGAGEGQREAESA